MKPSEKEELLKEIRGMIHKDVGPVIAAFMEYVDGRFDEMEEHHLGFLQELERLCYAIFSRNDKF